MLDIKYLLQQATDLKASDLHLISGSPPTIRVNGNLMPLQGSYILTSELISEGLKNLVQADIFEKLAVNKEIDFSLPFSEKARFRINAYSQKSNLAVSFRLISLEIPEIDKLGLPKVLHGFTSLKQGLILVTGPTGHGKSTTLAAVLNEINKTRSCHIVTIEDPIEFVFKPEMSIVSQREMRTDTHSWQVALRSILRQDPDVVLIGEMRDFETISSAVTIAETGHLVFATLHTNSASQTVDRIVDVFPQDQQNQIRMQLSSVLEAVFSQRLIPSISGKRVVAYEAMFGTNAIKTAIREGKTHQIDSIIQNSHSLGMNTLESSLASLVKAGTVSLEVAKLWSLRPDDLNRLIKL